MIIVNGTMRNKKGQFIKKIWRMVEYAWVVCIDVECNDLRLKNKV